MKNTPSEPTTAQRFAAWAGAWLIRALFATLRLRVSDPGNYRRSPPPGPHIYTFWHNRILPATATFRLIYPPGRRGLLVLTSPSRDGMWLELLAANLGMGSIRGSSSRRGAVALLELMDKIEAGYDIAITPDGPRGPRYVLGPGPVYLAAKAGIPIIPAHFKMHGCLRLKTWDGFTIPLPFSQVEITMGAPIPPSPSLEEHDLEKTRAQIEAVMRAQAD